MGIELVKGENTFREYDIHADSEQIHLEIVTDSLNLLLATAEAKYPNLFDSSLKTPIQKEQSFTIIKIDDSVVPIIPKSKDSTMTKDFLEKE